MNTEVRELDSDELDQINGAVTEGGCIPPFLPNPFPFWPPYQVPETTYN